MAFLEKFTDHEKEILVSLPYKAGIWVSKADSIGGASADIREKDMLDKIINEKGKGMFESAFVHEVMSETATRRQDWDIWAQNTDDVLRQAEDAMNLVAEKMPEHECDAYSANIMAIGVKVAEAFREFDADTSLVERLHLQVGLLGETVMRIITRDKNFKPSSALNISYEEDKALSALYKALYKDAA